MTLKPTRAGHRDLERPHWARRDQLCSPLSPPLPDKALKPTIANAVGALNRYFSHRRAATTRWRCIAHERPQAR